MAKQAAKFFTLIFAFLAMQALGEGMADCEILDFQNYTTPSWIFFCVYWGIGISLAVHLSTKEWNP